MIGRRLSGLVAFSLTVVSALMSVGSYALPPMVVRMGVYEDHLDDIRRIDNLADSRCPTLSEATATFDQVVLEYTILCRIMMEAGVDLRLKLIPFPIQDRVLQSLANGELDISGFGIWEKDAVGPEFMLSVPLLDKGEFSKGLYTSRERVDELAYPDRKMLKSLVGVINRNWDFDWEALNCGNIRRLHVDSYENMFKLVAMQRADVVPVTFSAEPDMAKHEFGVSLYPVPGVKILFPESTHFVLSGQWQAKDEIQDILKAGIEKMRMSGELKRLYQNVGLLNPQTDSWQPLCLHLNR